jgi:putative oxidoreductase
MHAVPAMELPPATSPSLAWRLAPWIFQILSAAILAQTLFFKFTYAPETQYIFESRGGRAAATAVGVAELICVALLLIPATSAFGAVFSLAVISGAIFTHLTSLGLEVKDPTTGEGDGGLLFALALTVLVSSLIVLAFRWRQLPFLGLQRAAS